MRYYCGIDLHAKQCFLCVIDEEEKILLKKALPNSLELILQLLGAFPCKPSVAVESTLNWYWLVDGLQEAGYEVKLAHTLGLHMITGAKVKTDRRDALSLARLLRLGAIPLAYIYPKEKRPIRDLLRTRSRMVSLRANAYGTLRRILMQYGHSSAVIKKFAEEQICRHFDHPAIQASCQLELERVRLYSREIAILEDYILHTVADQPVFDLLQTIPGVGKILALTIYYEVGDIGRFEDPRSFCSYSRVVPGAANSAGVVSRGKGSKQGNPYLKWAFTQAALYAVRFNAGIRKFRQAHLARRRSKSRKIVSLSIVAHKLAIAAYYVIKGQEPFKQELMFGQ